MAYHDELLQQSFEFGGKPSPTQADLRRSVSAAYYALFHLLIAETVANWSLDSSRGALSRMFDHLQMKKVSRRTFNPEQFPFLNEDKMVVSKLRKVAEAFVLLQDQRHIADYDNSTRWTQSEAREEVARASDAFSIWQSIRHEKIAHDYLVALLIKTRD